jgi:CheY-like chemotaxis protein
MSAGHAFISYVREDTDQVDWLQEMLEAAGVRVWRDTADLWPGEDWRIKIQEAITSDALVFIACFSTRSVARPKSYQNEELTLAAEQLRQRRPGDPWLIPVRLDDCDIPAIGLGGGRTLASIQRVDLFGADRSRAAKRLVIAVVRLLEQQTPTGGRPFGYERPAGEATETLARIELEDHDRNVGASYMARVLIIDNDPFWLDRISGSLPEYDVDTARDYQEAVRLLHQKTYDIAIVDLNLLDTPEYHADDNLGGRILRLLRSEYPGTCRIALTGHTPSRVMGIVHEYGLADLLLKQNMMLNAVGKVVQDALAGKSAELQPGVRVSRLAAQDDLNRWQTNRTWVFEQRRRELRNDLNSPPRGLSEANAGERRAVLLAQIDAVDREQAEFERQCSDVYEELNAASTSEATSAAVGRIDAIKKRFGSGADTAM